MGREKKEILPLAWNKLRSALPAAATKWSKEETHQRATSGSFLFGPDSLLLSQRKNKLTSFKQS